ncbi:MAG TPA: methyltransferase domain-containing protein [Actinospica sp.]|nr:methyltransferase domain-containing protein [Actinospica sp.]
MNPEIPLNRLAPLTPNAWLRYDVITRMMPPGVRDVLEIGCGQGALGTRLATRYRYVGLEPDPQSFEVAKARLGSLPASAEAADAGGEVRNCSILTLDAAERYDLVCAFEVLEHIEDDQSALTQWAEHLRPGGWLMLSVPAHQRRYAAADEHVGHFRRYDPDHLAGLIEKVGFKHVDIREYGAPLGYLLEFGRNAVARRRLARMADTDMQARTGASGRHLQPANPAVSAAARYGTAPFRYLQRTFPHGTGLVMRAQLPG